jgi:hypothetical protein
MLLRSSLASKEKLWVKKKTSIRFYARGPLGRPRLHLFSGGGLDQAITCRLRREE